MFKKISKIIGVEFSLKMSLMFYTCWVLKWTNHRFKMESWVYQVSNFLYQLVMLHVKSFYFMLFAACTIYRITEWVRLEGTTVGPLVQSPNQGHPRVHDMRLHPGGSWISSVKETPQPLWAIFSSEIFHCVLLSFTLIYFLLKTLWEERKQSILHELVI